MIKQILACVSAAALGSAATYFAMRAEPTVAETRTPAPLASAAPKPATPSETPEAKPAGEAPRAPTRKAETAPLGLLPDSIEGVTPAQLDRCRVALLKTFKDDGVKDARARIVELRKEAVYASDAQKRALRQDLETAVLDLRQATKAAMLAADDSLTAELTDKVLDAWEDLIKQRAKQLKK
jgi:hypothetical protein